MLESGVSQVKMKSNSKRYSTPALEKGLDILELFARERSGMTKSDVARSLNRTVQEVLRMLRCLEERGYISIGEDERFSLTLRLFKLVNEYPPVHRLASEALPIMQALAHELNQSCHLGVLDGADIVIVAQVDSPRSPRLSVKLGSVVDLMHAATGYVILAHQPPEIFDRAVSEWRRRTNQSLPRDLKHHLSTIEKVGYEERASYEIHGVTNFSYPILDENGFAVAALTVPHLERIGDKPDHDAVHRSLAAAARELSDKIGGDGSTTAKSKRIGALGAG
jgi:DNA-binding IclR family transcriptional regulator